MLGCFVIGEDKAFIIETDKIKTISQLRDTIKAYKENVFKTFDPNQLTLWKVDIPEIKKQEINADTDIAQKFGAVELEEDFDTIEEHFGTNPTAKHINIIVQMPTPLPTTTEKGKRPLENSDEKNENQAKKGKLIDQELIRDLIKDLVEIDTNQPNFTLPPLPGIDKSIVCNRKCYIYLRNLILNDDNDNGYRRYYITGNPGVGKTYFGRLMLIELLKQGKQVLMDYKGFTALIDPTDPKNCLQEVKDEYKYRQIAQQKHIWCIIDGVTPKVGHDFDGGKLILVSSPKKEIIGDFMKHQNRKKFNMPTWKEEEVDEYWKQIHENKTTVTLESLKEKFRLCGGIARWLFDTRMTLEDIRYNIAIAITSIDAKILDYHGQVIRGEELTHRLIHIHTNLPPADNDEDPDPDSDPYTKSICYFASEQVANLCLEKLKKDDNEKLRKFMENTKDISEMGSLRGQLFEIICHVILHSGNNFLVRDLQNGRVETKNFEILKEEFYDKVPEINENEKCYYRPYSKTSKSIDSYIHSNQLLQITVAKKHGIKQKGIKNLKSILNKSNDIYLYFAIPKDNFDSLTKKQNYLDGEKKAVYVEDWIDKIKQYSLCVDLDQFLLS